MGKAEQLGKKLGATQKEAGLNLNRKAENFLQPHRTVDNINMIQPYVTEFAASSGTSALLTFMVTEFPVPCTVNPPILHVTTNSFFEGDSPGVVTRLADTSNVINPPTPDFTLVNGGIQVPMDGCYNVFWTSGAWGVGYFSSKIIAVTIRREHEGRFYPIRTVTQGATGVTAILGPLIFSYVPPSPVYGVVECVAGDRITISMNQSGIGDPYPWLSGGLSGFFYSPRDGSQIRVTLVAVAEK